MYEQMAADRRRLRSLIAIIARTSVMKLSSKLYLFGKIGVVQVGDVAVRVHVVVGLLLL